jgi:hypothetical protein
VLNRSVNLGKLRMDRFLALLQLSLEVGFLLAG